MGTPRRSRRDTGEAKGRGDEIHDLLYAVIGADDLLLTSGKDIVIAPPLPQL